jgi:hypothetical protein
MQNSTPVKQQTKFGGFGWGWIEAQALAAVLSAHEADTAMHALVAAMIFAHRGAKGLMNPSIEEIARLIRRDDRTVKRYLKTLKAWGVLDWKSGGLRGAQRISNEYRFGPKLVEQMNRIAAESSVGRVDVPQSREIGGASSVGHDGASSVGHSSVPVSTALEARTTSCDSDESRRDRIVESEPEAHKIEAGSPIKEKQQQTADRELGGVREKHVPAEAQVAAPQLVLSGEPELPKKKPSKSTAADQRHPLFMEMIFKAHKHFVGIEPMMNGAVRKNLSALLRDCPKLTREQFRTWLTNYHDSEDHNPSDQPSFYIHKVANYALGSVDRYKRPKVVAVNARSE